MLSSEEAKRLSNFEFYVIFFGMCLLHKLNFFHNKNVQRSKKYETQEAINERILLAFIFRI